MVEMKGVLTIIGVLGVLNIGCTDPDKGCEIQGEPVGVGESIPLAEGTILCTCTASGVDCADTDGGGRRVGPDDLDEGLPPVDGAPLIDMNADATVVRDISVDTGPDARPDRAVIVDAGLIDCPPFPSIGGFCEGEQQVCHYGIAFDCCGAQYPADTSCRCVGGRFDCVDHVALCQEVPDGPRCARYGQMCARWQDIRSAWQFGRPAQEEGEWDGDPDTCRPGDMDPTWRARALLHLNHYRFMAGVKPVRTQPRMNRQAQACALVIRVTRILTHNLPEDAMCWSPDAAHSALNSNMDRTPAVASMGRYLLDPGEANRARLPHRLWILSPSARDVGIGSTHESSCLQIIDGAVRDDRDPPWVAWPPPGPVPQQLTVLRDGGWSVQSSVINLSRARVSITRNGEEMPIETRILTAGGGAAWGVAFDLDGWLPEVGETYHVTVDNVYGNGWEGPIEYDVEPVNCE